MNRRLILMDSKGEKVLHNYSLTLFLLLEFSKETHSGFKSVNHIGILSILFSKHSFSSFNNTF